jgi:biopolymer transport protein ExbD
VFSIVMMVRADVLNVDLPELASGVPAERVEPITIAVGDDGGLFVNRQEAEMDSVVGMVVAIREEQPSAPIVLAVDVESSSGVLIELADRLTGAGLGAFSILGQRVESENVLVEDGGSE